MFNMEVAGSYMGRIYRARVNASVLDGGWRGVALSDGWKDLCCRVRQWGACCLVVLLKKLDGVLDAFSGFPGSALGNYRRIRNVNGHT